jgi:hypothetical protein
MFTPEAIIDSVQNAKKQFVNTVITNESFKKELIKLVDAQTEFAKGQVKTTLSIAEAFVKNATNAVYSK